jgi:hypothetical protein
VRSLIGVPRWRAAQVPPSAETQFLTEFDKFSPEA